ncbi:MAG: prepilin-type N-terminal cleavage/methylation domain-containing protein [Candidatus Paceibacterota bacterium]
MQRIKINAFTLIELLVVIAIIGILSALIVVGMSSATNSARIAKSQVFANSLKNSLMDSLISEWKFDGTANDSWGSNNGLIVGAVEGSDCISGKCLAFDGNDSVDYTGTIANVQTISYWIKPNSINETVINLGNSAYVDSNGYLSGTVPSSAITYVDGIVEALGSDAVTNGNMETGNPPTGWSTYLTSSVADERTGGAGQYSLNIIGDVQTWVSSIPGPVLTQGKLYRVSGWIRSIGGTGGFTIAGSGYVTIKSWSNSTSVWKKGTAHFIAPSSTPYRVLTLSQNSSSNARYDDFSIKEITNPITASAWHHVAIITNTPINISNMTIGKVGTTFFTGSIDDVRIYNSAMTTSQIEQNYFGGLNRLLVNNQINDQEYKKRIAELTSNYAKN